MPDVTKQGVRNGVHTRDLNAVQRVSMALKLRASKVRYEDIARQCGYGSPQAAHKAVMRELERTIVADVVELRREDCATLDTLQTECMMLALDRNYKGRLFAVDRILAIMERRARLMGLDVKADEAVVNQNYTKTIVLDVLGGQDGSS